MFTVLTLGLHAVASTVLCLLVISIALSRKDKNRSLRAFLLSLGSYAAWSALYAFARIWALAFSPSDFLGSIVGMISIGLGWMVFNFSLAFPGRDQVRAERVVLRITAGITFLFLISTLSPEFATNRRLVDGMIAVDRGVIYYIATSWTYLLGFTGMGILIYKWASEPRSRYKTLLWYSLFCLVPVLCFIFWFSFLLPWLFPHAPQNPWVGTVSSVFVTIVIFIAISRNGIYDIQTVIHKTLFLVFLTSVAVACIYVPIGIYLSELLKMQQGLGLTLLLGLVISHAALAMLYPKISGIILGKTKNGDDLLRQILVLSSDVERDSYEVCHDVAVLLRLSFQSEKVVAAIPEGRQFRILIPEPHDLDSTAQILLLNNLNDNVRATRLIAHASFNSTIDFDLRNALLTEFKIRKNRRSMKHAIDIRDSLLGLGFEAFLPIVHGNRLLAIFLLGRKPGNIPYFRSEHSTLRTIAAALSIVLKNVDDFGRMSRVNNALIQEGDQSVEPIQRIVSVSDEREIVYRGRTMEKTLQEIQKASQHDVSILLLGETGSGKDLAAQLIHASSDRKKHPFIAVNCGALADSLLENELFGHEKGAYTGADRTYRGLFEQADGGILFLDEIGEISENLQLKLLRVLEDRKVPRLGGKASPVDIRIIAATNRDLKERVDKGLFRADLFYRLNVMTIRLPPLRERREDIPVLAEHFLRRFADRFSRPRTRLSPEALRILSQNDWPGNVRELENAILHALVNSDGELIEVRDFPQLSSRISARGEFSDMGGQRRSGESLDDFLRRMESLLIQDALIRSRGNKAKAAKDLGLGRTTFYQKLALMGNKRTPRQSSK